MNRIIFLTITLISTVMSCVDAGADEQFALMLSKSALWKATGSYDAVYLPDGNSVVIRGWLWDCKTQKLIRRLNEFSPGQERFALSPCGTIFALIDQGYRGKGNERHWYGVTLVDVPTGKRIHTFEIHDLSILAGKISFSSDGTRIFLSSHDTFFTLSVAKRKIENTIPFGPNKALLPEELILAEVKPYNMPTDNIGLKDTSIAQSQFRIQLSSLNGDRNAKRLLSIERGYVEHLAFTSDGQFVFANIMGGAKKVDKKRCVFWEVKTGKKKKTESMLDGKFYVAMSGRIFNKKYVIMADEGHERNAVLDLSSGKLIPVQVDKTGQSLIIGMAPNGQDCVVSRYTRSESPSTSLWLGRLEKKNSKQADPR